MASTFRIIAHFRRWIERHSEYYVLADSGAATQEGQRTQKLAVFFDIEGGCAIDDQLSLISTYYDLGVRWMLLAYNKNNRLGGGCQDDDCGLTAFGKQVLDEMAQIGMVACCSHVGQRGRKIKNCHPAPQPPGSDSRQRPPQLLLPLFSYCSDAPRTCR